MFFIYPASLATLYNNYNIIIIDCIYKTNKYNLPLYHITGRTSIDKIFDIGFSFITNKYEEIYSLIIADLEAVFTDHILDRKPKVLVTDKELALKNTLRKSKFFGEVPQIICQWYIEMNVLIYVQHQWNKKVIKTKKDKNKIYLLYRAFISYFTKLLCCILAEFSAT